MRGTAALAALWLAATSACASSEQPPGRAEGEGGPTALEEGDPSGGLVPPLAKHPWEKTEISTMADGTHSVFGLEIPRGMTPVPGPHMVYRFEGIHPIDAVKRNVMRQVETGTLIEEPSGWVVRKARVLEPDGETDPGTRLAMRIFRGRRGGATLDVWVEREEHATRRKREIAESSSAAGASATAGERRGGAVRDRDEEGARRTAWEVMEKVQRGEPLTAEERKSSLFY